MSYTMTLDVPQKAAAYVKRQGPRFENELRVLFLAFIQTKMQCEDAERLAAHDGEVPGKKLLASFREGDRIISGKRKTRWYKSAKELIEDCLA